MMAYRFEHLKCIKCTITDELWFSLYCPEHLTRAMTLEQAIAKAGDAHFEIELKGIYQKYKEMKKKAKKPKKK